MRKIYSRLFEFLLRLLILFQRLCGERYPAAPWGYWVRFHKAYIERRDGGRTVPDQLKFFVLALLFEDSLWREVNPPNDHQYQILLAEIDEPEALDPITIITKAVKIHYGILHHHGAPEVQRFESKLREGLAGVWPERRVSAHANN